MNLPKQKVILVLIDGLRYDTATEEMGFLEASVINNSASRWKMRCALPSLSRPLYETIHTGLPPLEHGITGNSMNWPSSHANVFSIAHLAGRRTAAAAYSWIAELYHHAPYDPVLDREIDDESRIIQHGRFYTEDETPDLEVFRDAEMLIQKFSPDYLLIHPMGCDYIGHQQGGESNAYKRQAARADTLLAERVPAWIDRGYHVLVTSDHGMDIQGWHGGTREEVTAVPFYHLGCNNHNVQEEEVSQLSVAPTVLRLMGLQPDVSMKASSLV